MRGWMVLAVVVALAGCAQPVRPYTSSYTPIEQQVAAIPIASHRVAVRPQSGRPPRGISLEAQILAAAETAARDAMRDPPATQFRNLRVVDFAGMENFSIVCGEINAKNAYGGYVGYTAFLINVHRFSSTEIRVSHPLIVPNEYGQPVMNRIRQHCGNLGLLR